MMTPAHSVAPDSADLEKTAEFPAPTRVAREAARTARDPSGTDTWVAPGPSDFESLELAVVRGQLAEAQTRFAATRTRLADTDARLAEARAALEAARAEIDALNRRLEASASAGTAAAATVPAARDRALEALLAERDRELAGAEQRLAELQQQLAAHLEALQSVEGRRGVFDALLRGLHCDVSQRDSRVAQLEAEIRAKDALIGGMRGMPSAGGTASATGPRSS